MCEFASENVTQNRYCLDFYQNCKHPRKGIIFRNDRLMHRFILRENYMMFPLVLYPPSHLRRCIA